MTLVYSILPLWLVLAAAYLFFAIPIVFFVSVCTLAFSLFVPNARGAARRPTAFFFLLSLIHLAAGYSLFSGRGANTSPNGFDVFLDLATVATPVIFLLALLLPLTPHTDDPHR